MEPAVEDDARRDAGPDRQEARATSPIRTGGAGGGPAPPLGRRFRGRWGCRGAPRGAARERQVVPVEVDGERHVAGLAVDAAGDADADRRDVVRRRAGLRERRGDEARDRVGGPLRGADGGRRHARASRGPVAVGLADEDRGLRAADVDADDELARHRANRHRRAAVGAPPRPSPSSAVRSRAEAPIPRGPGRLGASSIVDVPSTAWASDRRRASSRTASSHGSPRTATLPWSTTRSMSRTPISAGHGLAEGLARPPTTIRRASSSPASRPPRRPRGGAPPAVAASAGAEDGRRDARGRPPSRGRRSRGSWRPSRGSRTGRSGTRRRRPRPPCGRSRPAPKPSPWNSSPPMTTPAPMPRPTLIATRFAGRRLAASPLKSWIASAAARLSLATWTGTP